VKKLLGKRLAFITLMILVLIFAGCSSKNGDKNDHNSNEENYSNAVKFTITGIEPVAGITVTTEEALESYDNLHGWTLEQSSTTAMASELDRAMKNEEPIIITGWNPHWTFAKYPDMKYLKDPKGVYGEEEVIKTLARKGLKDDKPNAFKLIDQFNWEVEDMEKIMLESHETGDDISESAKRWVEDNPKKIAEWTEGVDDVDGEEIELASTQWDSELSSTYVVAEVLEQKGFEVTVTPVDLAVMYEAVANGDADATLAVWMPITTKEFYDKYEDDFDDLGVNLEGAKIGLVVPDYMDIESIEDLEPVK